MEARDTILSGTSALVIDLLRSGRAVRFVAKGHSMVPAIRSGDQLTVVPLPLHEARIGDVLACVVEGRLVVHRLVSRGGDGACVLRGDTASACDPPLTSAHVLGVVTTVERAGRAVRLGLGCERRALVWLSRAGLLRAAAVVRERLRRGGAIDGPEMRG